MADDVEVRRQLGLGPDYILGQAREMTAGSMQAPWQALAMGLLPGVRAGAAPRLTLPSSRKALAEAAGFDPAIYYQGRETPYPGRRAYQMVTDDPHMASMFADSSLAQKGVEGGHVMPLLVNRSGFADLTSKADLERIAQALVDRTPHYNRGDGRGVRALTIEEARAQLADPHNIINGRVNWAVEPIIEATKGAGFPGVPVHESWGKWGASDSHSLAVFDQSRLRSPWARFDPAMKDSKDLMAGLGGAAALPTLSLLLQQPERSPQQ